MAQQPPYYPQQQQQQQQPKKKTNGCLVALLVAVVVAVPMIGVMAALGIYGVRRYLVAAKTAEAKNTIGAITRGAVAAYEREATTGGAPAHRLCSSANPVPRAVMMAKKYLPSTAAGQDFNAGGPAAGWPCLRFAMTEPIYYQYHYQQGSGWVVPSIAPGADGFEVAAQGDLDGNGTTSKFARTGKVAGGQVVVSTEMFIENEFE
jgi:type IV pilus assembly protein PilA